MSLAFTTVQCRLLQQMLVTKLLHSLTGVRRPSLVYCSNSGFLWAIAQCAVELNNMTSNEQCYTHPTWPCRGKVLAAFLKSIGFIIPLMDAMYANYYTREVMVILVREFQTPDEEMKKIVLKVVKQCVGTDGVEPDYIRHEILPEFFRNFWVRRMALDRRNYRQLVETTVELANKVG